MKDLELENQRLRKAVSDLTLDKLILPRPPRETSKPRAPPCTASSMFDVNFTSPSAAPVRRSDSIARRNGRCQRGETMRSG